MAFLFAYEAYTSDPSTDAIAEAKQELERPQCGLAMSDEDVSYSEMRKVAIVYIGVFVAEWADRTQVVMIALHASQPLWPVIFGSLCAFALMCVFAVILGSFISSLRINKRLLNAMIAFAFVLFTIWTLVQGVYAL
jgi:putative Ca2+/H+ antiporter (TMEM165/GDT1 family)